jgi:ribose 5-phosphate isomerase B
MNSKSGLQGTIVIGADHAGFEYKEHIKQLLSSLNVAIEDMGTFDEKSCDYPDIAYKVARLVAKDGSRGILCCGSGIGMSMVANKVKGVRAALCDNDTTARLSRQHNNANILCIGARTTGAGVVDDIVTTWLSTEFEGGRHQRRVDKIDG